MRIAVDAMGGDKAPQVVVEGALAACNQLKLEVILVGKKDLVEKELSTYKIPSNLTLVDASQVIEMHESPAQACRQKTDSSIMVGTRLVKEKKAEAFFSAGNSGAVMAAGLINLKRLPGVSRPAIATVFPTLTGDCIIIDVGANVDCKPRNLLQFAIMGDIYARYILNEKNPKIGLLSIGEEEGKGNVLIQESAELIKKTNLNFIGNIEGREIMKGKADVVVCDGFVGNVLLKFGEGVAEALFTIFRNEIQKSLLMKLGAFLLKPIFHHIRKRTDYAEYGGAPLLGLGGICMIGHGVSSAKAIYNAIKLANEFVEKEINEYLLKEIKLYGWEEISENIL